MKEYAIERGQVNIKDLKAGLMDENDYIAAHQGLTLACHDAFVEYKGGILLVKRLKQPVKNFLWPLGGRIKRGISTEDSLKEKVLVESNLELTDLIELGYARTFFSADPFGHGKGTDSINFVYFGKGKGILKLDNLHEQPIIVLPEQYKSEYKNKLHPYVRDFMDLAINLVGK